MTTFSHFRALKTRMLGPMQDAGSWGRSKLVLSALLLYMAGQMSEGPALRIPSQPLVFQTPNATLTRGEG